MTIIYHNPRCSKSRATLALLRARGVEPRIVEYLKSPPDARKLREITEMLDCSISDIMRHGEKIYRKVVPEGSTPEERLIDLVVRHPILLERPIVFHDGRAAIGRPPEKVLEILGDADSPGELK